jgi:alpha-L-rhamnosidase
MPSSSAAVPVLPSLWLPDATPDERDVYAAFRAEFDLPAATTVEFQVLGASWFAGWLDGVRFCEGPARFPKNFPEYQTFVAPLAAGRHTLAFTVNHHGVTTRMLEQLPPFLACLARAGGQPLPLAWLCTRLTAYTPQVRRLNPQLGFIEWCDTRQLPAGWQEAGFAAPDWSEPVAVTPPLGPLRPLSSANALALEHPLTPLAAGGLVETFGYERDDIPARFFLRDLAPAELPPQGVWRRYDAGRVRLMRPRFVLDLPAGTVVEFAYCEALVQGRVSPWITLSAGDSCNLDHYIARGGPQEFSPLAPRGGRFLEVHILAPAASVKFLHEAVVERAYYGAAAGALHTGEALLDQAWSVGVESHRACAEDAITDNPTRERGQWAGDVVTVGMDVAAAAFGDLRLCRRSLVQCAQCARDDGLVAGLCPGGTGYLTTYAAQWVTACVHYWELTGDRTILDEMWPYAERNLAAFAAKTTADGLQDDLGWGFVDWGYVRNPGPSDMGVNLHVLTALASAVRWATTLGHTDRATDYRRQAEALRAIIARYFAAEFAAGGDAWTRIGYHRATLGLRQNFFAAAQAAEGRAFLRAHMLRCFPNRTDAPRLSDPSANNPQLITPYFAHFALPELIEHGDMDFVLGQYRTCWGWSLGGGRTTWLEVFDTRWSHCHQWGGCPTWQLSRYVLGLSPRFDRGAMHFDLSLATGSLAQAAGARPLPGRDDAILVSWKKDAAGLHYELQTPVPLTLHLSPALGGSSVAVDGKFMATWPVEGCR